MHRFLGVILVVMALILAIAPMLTDCQSQGRYLTTAEGKTVSMKCHWSGVAEVAAAVPLGMTGIYVLLNERKRITRFPSLISATSSLLALLIPTVLIGTCTNMDMICNVLMRPILISAGIIGMVTSIFLFVITGETKLPTAQAIA